MLLKLNYRITHVTCSFSLIGSTIPLVCCGFVLSVPGICSWFLLYLNLLPAMSDIQPPDIFFISCSFFFAVGSGLAGLCPSLPIPPVLAVSVLCLAVVF